MMKALTSSCSKAMVETLGPFSPRVPLCVSDRPEFCFTLRSKNEKKGWNLLLLKLVRNNDLYPVHAVPPKDQVDLETVEPQAQQSEQTNESKFVHVSFQLEKSCNFGEQFLIVGGDPVLGSWDPLEALPMTWSEGHVWAVELDMPAGQTFQYKFILEGEGGDIIWQPGSDRLIHTWETKNRIVVLEDWENVELQKITEEDQLAEPNEEPQVDFEVPTLAEFLNNPQEELDSKASEISSVEDTQIQSVEEPLAETVRQQITEEDQLAEPNEEPQVDFEVPTLAEFLNNPQEELDSKALEISSVEDTQIHAVEEPLAETVQQQITGNSISSSMEKPMSIVVENISSSGDLISSISHKSNKKSILQPSEESADSPGNDDIIHDLGQNGNPASLENQEKTIVESSLFDLEEGPVLVPGLPIPPTEPTDEADQGEVQETTKKDTSVEAFETQDQNIAKFSKEEETDDAIPQEINATINNGPELLYNKQHEESHLSPDMEDWPNYEPDDDNTVQNDIKWGQDTVNKFLTKLGFF
ncbi:Phosphoglucan, water dikinase, chloroplastic [Glycine soja]